MLFALLVVVGLFGGERKEYIFIYFVLVFCLFFVVFYVCIVFWCVFFF